jgi:cyclophilin family peptidyl-prolyl cis-trans isomerase
MLRRMRRSGRKRSVTRGAAWTAPLLCALAAPLHATEVAICTDRGRAVIELADELAPLHVENFLRYVDAGHYTGTVFHRVVPSFVVQGGGVDRRLRPRPTFGGVRSEASNGIANARGTVAAARGPDPNSANAQFFVNLEDNAQLDAGRDAGYTVFGRVKEGIAVFDEIGRLPTGRAGPFRSDVPTPLVAIKSVARHDEAALAALPADDRETALKSAIAGAAAAGNSADALRLVDHYRALCGPDDIEIATVEARFALASGNRTRAVYVLDDVLAALPAAAPERAGATELYRQALKVVPECEPAVAPPLPTAATATLEEMVEAQRQVREFVASGESYLGCLSELIDDEDRNAEDRNVGVVEHNRMVTVMEEVAASFNRELRAFKTRR